MAPKPFADLGAGLSSKTSALEPHPSGLPQHGTVGQLERVFTAGSTFLSGMLAYVVPAVEPFSPRQNKRITAARRSSESHRPQILRIIYRVHQAELRRPYHDNDTVVVADGGSRQWRQEHTQAAISQARWKFGVSISEKTCHDGQSSGRKSKQRNSTDSVVVHRLAVPLVGGLHK
jgi:hypothetical protein